MIEDIQIAVFGCRHNTRDFIDTLNNCGVEISLLITISQDTAEINKVSGYCDMSDMKNINNIVISNDYSLSSLDTNTLKILENYQIGFCIGWQRIIPKNILDLFDSGVYGMHATQHQLPYGKGRSPINWGIINNADSLYANIFKYDEYVDNGMIFSSKKIILNQLDDINTIQQKLSLIFCDESISLVNNIINNNLKLKEQNGSKGEFFYPKRNEEDGKIDFNSNMIDIVNFVRAQTKPYPGAYVLTNRNKYKVWRAIPFETDFKNFMKDLKNGKVVKTFEDGNVMITCNDGYVILTDHELPLRLDRYESIII